MKNKGSVLGILLIIFGIVIYLRKFEITALSSTTLILALLSFFLFYRRRQKSFLIIGLISLLYGLKHISEDLNILNFKISGEVVLIAFGLLFIYLYFKNENIGFLVPGTLLVSLGLYVSLMSHYNNIRLWPCFFILLGMAFYLIYFIALYEKENWPLVIGTMLCLFGVVLLGFSFNIINIKLLKYSKYFWPAILILMGLSIIRRRLRN